MKNSEKGKYVAMGMAISATVMGTVVPVIAKSTQENITAIYKNIKVVADGIPVELGKDEPFIYNGTTYLPVRAVGETIGKKVTWDGNSNTVYLGEVPGDKEYLVDICPPYDGKYYKIYKSTDNDYFTMSGEKRTNGFTLCDSGYSIINLNGQYTEMSFDVGHIDGKSLKDVVLNVYLDGKLSREIDLRAEDVAKKISIPLNLALQVKIELSEVSGYSSYYGFADVEIR